MTSKKPEKEISILELSRMWNDFDDKAKAYMAKKAYRDELSTILRKEPILDVSEDDIVVLSAHDDENAPYTSPKKSKQTSQTESDKAPGPVVIDLDSDGEDTNAPKTAIPGPGVPDRLNFGKIREQIGFLETFQDVFGRERDAAFQDHLTGAEAKHADVEAMLELNDWIPYLERRLKTKVSGPLVYTGFPMVDQIQFIAHPNMHPTIDDGNCYFTAMALLLYGTARSWLRVKAEHLSYLEHALTNKNHKRHQFYTRLNASFSETWATAHGGGKQWSGAPNLWERLQIPNCWTSDEMCALTADVYGVFIVLYSFTFNRTTRMGNVYDMRTYGSFNNRHILAAYLNRNHFAPLIPNEHYLAEFTFPRITLEQTKKLKLRTSGRNYTEARDGPHHYFRCSPDSAPTTLSYPSFEEVHLYMVAGYGSTHPTKQAPVNPNVKPVSPVARPPPGTTIKPGPITGSTTLHDNISGFVVKPESKPTLKPPGSYKPWRPPGSRTTTVGTTKPPGGQKPRKPTTVAPIIPGTTKPPEDQKPWKPPGSITGMQIPGTGSLYGGTGLFKPILRRPPTGKPIPPLTPTNAGTLKPPGTDTVNPPGVKPEIKPVVKPDEGSGGVTTTTTTTTPGNNKHRTDESGSEEPTDTPTRPRPGKRKPGPGQRPNKRIKTDHNKPHQTPRYGWEDSPPPTSSSEEEDSDKGGNEATDNQKPVLKPPGSALKPPGSSSKIKPGVQFEVDNNNNNNKNQNKNRNKDKKPVRTRKSDVDPSYKPPAESEEDDSDSEEQDEQEQEEKPGTTTTTTTIQPKPPGPSTPGTGTGTGSLRGKRKPAPGLPPLTVTNPKYETPDIRYLVPNLSTPIDAPSFDGGAEENGMVEVGGLGPATPVTPGKGRTKGEKLRNRKKRTPK